MPAQTMPPDPWSAFLEWLTTVLVPSWSGLMALLPYAIVLFLIGPIVTLLVLAWGWHLLRRRRGRVRRVVLQPVPVPRAEDGRLLLPANVPYCETHALLYPPAARRCDVDGADLSVACPVDGTVRAADVTTCASCGTTYLLGKGSRAVVVAPASGPPAGGAAVA